MKSVQSVFYVFFSGSFFVLSQRDKLFMTFVFFTFLNVTEKSIMSFEPSPVVAVFQIKERENDVALKYYQKTVASLDQLSFEDRQFALVRGVLAGNVFDWGAKAVSECVLL